MERTWWNISAFSRLVTIVWTGVTLLAVPSPASAQDVAADYREVFGEDFIRAEHYLAENTWMADTVTAHGLDPCFVYAVVFPELIRYSSITDFMETRALEVLYIQYGSPYSDFSVGHFQMKPSFAESIEADRRRPEAHSGKSVSGEKVIADSSDVSLRKSRLLRLKSAQGQLAYLLAFIQVVHDLYPEWDTLSADRKLRYYACAYQGGYHRGREVLESMVKEKYYYTGLPIGSTRYSYADISAFYYRECKCP
jgi:hypothetical protein